MHLLKFPFRFHVCVCFSFSFDTVYYRFLVVLGERPVNPDGLTEQVRSCKFRYWTLFQFLSVSFRNCAPLTLHSFILWIYYQPLSPTKDGRIVSANSSDAAIVGPSRNVTGQPDFLDAGEDYSISHPLKAYVSHK